MHTKSIRDILKVRSSAIKRAHTEDYFVRKFRIYPTNEQMVKLTEFYGCVRYVYNRTLGDNSRAYEAWKNSWSNPETKPSWSYYQSANLLPVLREEKEFLKPCPSQALQASVKNLANAYSKFFQWDSKYPKFKKRKLGGTLHFPQGVVIEKNSIRVPKFLEGIQSIVHDLPGENYEISEWVISTTPDGKSYISVTWRRAEKESSFKAWYTKKNKEKRENILGKIPDSLKENEVVGIDLGLKDFAIIHNGTETSVIWNPKFRCKWAKKIRKASRHLARCKKGSANRAKARLRLARAHKRQTNELQNFLHQLTKTLGESQAQVFVIETLKVRNMLKNHKLARSISDVAWGEFVRILSYKLERFWKTLVSVDTFFPSSKLCSECGHKHSELELKDREWTCSECGTHHDRDENAAKNIRTEWIRILQKCHRELCTITPFWGDLRPIGNSRQFSVMRESNWTIFSLEATSLVY